ncbi:MAG: hypothetical protein ACOCUS_00210 [Polyangiales bacterium]
MRLLWVIALAGLCAACSDGRRVGSDAGDTGDGGAPAGDAAAGSDAGGGRDAGTPPGSDGGSGAEDGGSMGSDAGADDPNELVWRLDGEEVARSTGAEAAADYLFLPHYGRNVQAYWSSPPAPGVYTCAEMGSGVRVGLLTMDNTWANLDDLPERWKTLNIPNCDYGPDSYTVTLDLATTADRYTGTLQIEVVGAEERAGEVLTVDGTFDIAY